MNVLESDHSCFVLPRWLPFEATATGLDLSSFPGKAPAITPAAMSESFAEDLLKFQANPNPVFAADLMGAAQTLGSTAIAREFAEYIRRNPEAGPAAQGMAGRILGNLELAYEPTVPGFHKAIATQKTYLSKFPRDAITWIDRALHYTILGVNDKARRCVVIALGLAPENRFIVRSAVRFFVHIGDWDAARYYAERAFNATSDPWIGAPLTSILTRDGKIPNNLRAAFQKALESEEDFHFSELREAVGTLELFKGAATRARKAFRRAWIQPASSVIAHSQWVMREKLPGLAGVVQIDFRQSAQAMAEIAIARMDFETARVYLRQWILEEPYSVAPYMELSWIECSDERFADAVRTVDAGLVANPRDGRLLNNKTFALLKLGKVEEAAQTWARTIGSTGPQNAVVNKATHGLLLMMQGHVEDGRTQYAECIQQAIEQKDRRLAIRATLNYLVSEYDVNKSVDPEFLNLVSNALKGERSPWVLAAGQALCRRLARVHPSENAPREVEAAARFISRQKAEESAFQHALKPVSDSVIDVPAFPAIEGVQGLDIGHLPGLGR